LIVQLLMLSAGLWMVRQDSFYRPYQLMHRLERPDGAQLRQFLKLGVPSALAILVEVTSFTLMALFIARLGTQAAAAHQIASNLTALLYMVPLSIGIATSARVSFWLGAQDTAQAHHALKSGLLMGSGLALLASSLLWACRTPLASLYSRDPQIVTLGAGLLAWVAAYHLADATQAIAVFVLRCWRVTLAPLVVYSVLLWGVGLGGGYVVTYHDTRFGVAQWHPQALWITSTMALAITAGLMLILLWRHVRQR
jgi:MATE family multidrug resistance protein